MVEERGGGAGVGWGGGAICEGVSRRAKGLKVWYCECRYFRVYTFSRICKIYNITWIYIGVFDKIASKRKVIFMLYIFSRIFQKRE